MTSLWIGPRANGGQLLKEGRKRVIRRVGTAGEYYETAPGEWWTLSPQRGFVRVPSDCRGLLDALRRETRGAELKAIREQWYRDRAKFGAKLADEYLDERTEAVLRRGSLP